MIDLLQVTPSGSFSGSTTGSPLQTALILGGLGLFVAQVLLGIDVIGTVAGLLPGGGGGGGGSDSTTTTRSSGGGSSLPLVGPVVSFIGSPVGVAVAGLLAVLALVASGALPAELQLPVGTVAILVPVFLILRLWGLFDFRVFALLAGVSALIAVSSIEGDLASTLFSGRNGIITILALAAVFYILWTSDPNDGQQRPVVLRVGDRIRRDDDE